VASAHPPRPRRGRLLVLLLAFAALASLYSVATPVFEGPDEIWHFAFASHLADGNGLPVLSAEQPNLLLRNAAHPPLYYLLVAALIAPIDRSDFPGEFHFNLASPHITPGSLSDRPNLLIHSAHEDWPYRQSVLAVHLGRLVSVALSVLTVWGVYAGSLRLVPGREDLALLAAALTAFVPQFVFGAATINNDALASAAGAWLLVALLELMRCVHGPGDAAELAFRGEREGNAPRGNASSRAWPEHPAAEPAFGGERDGRDAEAAFRGERREAARRGNDTMRGRAGPATSPRNAHSAGSDKGVGSDTREGSDDAAVWEDSPGRDGGPGSAMRGGSGHLWAMAGGVLLGAGLLSKLSMVILLPLPVAAVALAAWKARGQRTGLIARSLAALTLVYGVAALAAGWWFARNWLLYGDPLAWREWKVLSGAGRTGVTLAQFASDMVMLFGTFWADFGLRADRTWVWAFGVLTGVALLGLLRRWRRGDWPALNRAGLALGLLWLALLSVSMARYALVVINVHGRLLYPAITVAATVLALGLTGFGPRVGLWLARGAAGVLCLVTAGVPFALIGPAFARPVVARGELPLSAAPASASFGEALTLAGYSLGAARLAPGEALAVTSFWRLAPNAAAPADAHAVLALIRPDGVVLGRTEARLGSSVYPTSVWRPRDLVRLAVSVPTEARTDGPTVAEVVVGVRGDTATLMPGPHGDTVRLGRVAVASGAPCATPPNGGQTFGGLVRLAGYALDARGVTLCWVALQPIDADYTVFVHILERAGGLLDTGDGPPRDGLYPTSAWLPGEQVEDRHEVAIPDGASVEVGLYRLEDGARLPLDGSNATELRLAP
jgi:hypothetical protein